MLPAYLMASWYTCPSQTPMCAFASSQKPPVVPLVCFPTSFLLAPPFKHREATEEKKKRRKKHWRPFYKGGLLDFPEAESRFLWKCFFQLGHPASFAREALSEPAWVMARSQIFSRVSDIHQQFLEGHENVDAHYAPATLQKLLRGGQRSL